MKVSYFRSLDRMLMVYVYQNYYYWIVICPGYLKLEKMKVTLLQSDFYYDRSDPRIRDMNFYFPTQTTYLMAALSSLEAFSYPQGNLVH